MEEESQTFNVFHVEEAVGSSYIPVQEDFVVARGIQSVLGFGGLLPTEHLFAVIVFSKARISRETANLFRAVALGVRMAVLPVLEEKILTEEKGSFEEVESLRAIRNAQEELLAVFRTTVVEQSDKLDGTLAELQKTNVDLQSTLDDLTEAQSKLVDFEARLVSKYAVEKLRDPATYRVAFTVGTLINLFGHFLVPFMRGRSDVWTRFVAEFQERPILAACTILLAYLFPIICPGPLGGDIAPSEPRRRVARESIGLQAGPRIPRRPGRAHHRRRGRHQGRAGPGTSWPAPRTSSAAACGRRSSNYNARESTCRAKPWFMSTRSTTPFSWHTRRLPTVR